ncbi:MAG: helix-turn-helix transcriptional regulator [Bryobacteraceae bacterium]|nr:helix-turn-helix transcriptional regulator [Bryobacteraceae bacterium]
MRIANASLSRLIGLIYAAGEDPRRWPEFLESFADRIGGRQTNLLLCDVREPASSLLASVRADPVTNREFHRDWAGERNPYLTCGHPGMRTSGSVVISEQLIADERKRRTPFYNEFERRHDIEALVGLNIVVRPPVMFSITTHFSRRDGERRGEQIELCRLLMPHLQRSVSLHRLLGDARGRAQAIERALESVNIGVAFVDERGRLLHANGEAERIVRARDAIILRFNRLRGATPDAEDRLRNAIVKACRGVGEIVAVERAGGAGYYQVTACPVNPEGPAGRFRAAAVLLIRDTAKLAAPAGGDLRRLFGLTAAESKVARALLDDSTIAAIAGEFQLSENTIRTHVKNIYSKTGVSKRSALVRLLCAALEPRNL